MIFQRMSVKCPACSFESPDGSLFCDFCKEPFRKKTAADSQVVSELKRLPPEELLKRLPAELLKDADKERLPQLPPSVKPLAWLFLAAWLVIGLIAGAMALAKLRRLQSEPPRVAPAPPRNP